MLRSKRAQREGAAVAILLIVIALFMTFYILFIPPEDRNQLLQINQTNTSEGSSVGQVELLAESPGWVTPTAESATIHGIPSVNVFLKSEPKIINLAQSLVVEKSVFSK